MRPADLLIYSSQTLMRQRFRSTMILLSTGLGVAAVLMLTAVGEGARGYVTAEFSYLGRDTLIIFPGRKETTGGMPPVIDSAFREITLNDVFLLARRVSAVSKLAPMIVGNADVSNGASLHAGLVVGTTPSLLELRKLTLVQGNNLSEGDLRRATAEALIGEKLKAELFDSRQAVGEFIRIGDSRFRVVGVIAGRGDSLGLDFSEAAVIQVAAAQRLFNVSGMYRVFARINADVTLENAKQQIEDFMAERHQNVLDVTVVSPDAMMSTFNRIMVAMTLVIGALGGISLLVAGILIMNVMMISVSQRTREIGLLKALGASSKDILRVFLTEAMMMTSAGIVVGIVIGISAVWIAGVWRPDIPFATPLWAVFTAAFVAMVSGLAFSWLPAWRASRLQPVAALQKT